MIAFKKYFVYTCIYKIILYIQLYFVYTIVYTFNQGLKKQSYCLHKDSGFDIEKCFLYLVGKQIFQIDSNWGTDILAQETPKFKL